MIRMYENDGIESDGRNQREFESFICEMLHENGIVVQPICDRPPGHRCGNLLGIDIIYDPLMEQRGGVYIETHVMEPPPLPILIRSTFFRDTDAWLYGIGDYDQFFIFGKKILQGIVSVATKYFDDLIHLERHETPTGRGILLPLDQAERLADRIFRFKIGATSSLTRP